MRSATLAPFGPAIMRRAMIDRRGLSDRPTCGWRCASNANVRCGSRVDLGRLTAHLSHMQ